MNTDFEKCSKLENGFFYTFEYYPRKPQMLYDKTPFIFCVGPVEKRDNFFVGLNFHHLTIKEREQLIYKMQEQYDIMSSEKQRCISEMSLNRLVPGVGFGIRIYNMQNVYELYRIKQAAAAKYIYNQGNIYMATPNDKYLKYMINSGVYKTSDATA